MHSRFPRYGHEFASSGLAAMAPDRGIRTYRSTIGPDLVEPPYPSTEQVRTDLADAVQILNRLLDGLHQAGLGAIATPLVESVNDIRVVAGVVDQRLQRGEVMREERNERAGELWAIQRVIEGDHVETDSGVVQEVTELARKAELVEEAVAGKTAAVDTLRDSLAQRVRLLRLIDGYDEVLRREVAAGRLSRGSVSRIRNAAHREARKLDESLGTVEAGTEPLPGE